jgi:lysophospholipase L1-like esterase
MPVRLLTCLCLLAGLLLPTAAEGFLRDGDVWVFLGDSITDAGPYRATVERLCRFYHPQAKLTFVNRGVPGALATASAEQFAKARAEDRPTIVSVMTGMNNSINSAWRAGQPMEPALASYRTSILELTRTLKRNGLTVILLSPTLTDERLGWSSMWELAGTEAFLRRCGAIVQEIAAAEGVIYLPAAEEFEAAQRALAPEQVLRHDGVHPHAAGQYRIAATFLRHLALDGPLDGKRMVLAERKACDIQVALHARFAAPGATELPLTLTAAPGPATLTWEYHGQRKVQTLTLNGKETITLPLPAALPQQPGESDSVLLEVARGDVKRLFVIDIAATRVLHPVDGVVRGTVDAPADRPEGRRVGTWSLRRAGKALVIDAEVFDNDLCRDFSWPWGRDGVNVWLDLRPPARFADVGIDNDVSLTLVTVQEQPAFGATTFWWLGRGLSSAAAVSAIRTPTGYTMRLVVDGKLSKWTTFDASKTDLIGFAPIFVDLDAGGKALNFYRPYETQRPLDHYGNGLMLVDFANQFPGDAICNVALSAL